MIRDLTTEELIRAKFNDVNETLRGRRYTFNLQSRDGSISVFNKDEGNPDLHDWGIGINFGPIPAVNNYYITPYTVDYNRVPLPITYKIHVSINKYDVRRDHISFDVIINHRNHPRQNPSYGDKYLKFHYYSDTETPQLTHKDFTRYGDICLMLDDRLREILQSVLNAGRAHGILTNFRPGYRFRNSCRADGRFLGILRERTFREKYLKYKAKYLELKASMRLGSNI